MVSVWETFRSMREGRCRESGRSLEARCREVPLRYTFNLLNQDTSLITTPHFTQHQN